MTNVVYKTNIKQNKIFIPLKFTYEKNDTGFKAAIGDFTNKLTSLGSEDSSTIIRQIEGNNSICDGSEKGLRFFEDPYNTQKAIDVSVGRWHTEYKYIESMQYDYKNNNCVQISLSKEFDNIPTIGDNKPTETFIPVIIEFSDDTEVTYSPVFLAKNDDSDSPGNNDDTSKPDRHNTYIHLQITCSSGWNGHLSSVSIDGQTLDESLPDNFDKNNPSGYEFNVNDNKVSEGDDTHMNIYIFDTNGQKRFDFNTLSIEIDTDKSGQVKVADFAGMFCTFVKGQNEELYIQNYKEQKEPTNELSKQLKFSAFKDDSVIQLDSSIQINVILKPLVKDY